MTTKIAVGAIMGAAAAGSLTGAWIPAGIAALTAGGRVVLSEKTREPIGRRINALADKAGVFGKSKILRAVAPTALGGGLGYGLTVGLNWLLYGGVAAASAAAERASVTGVPEVPQVAASLDVPAPSDTPQSVARPTAPPEAPPAAPPEAPPPEAPPRTVTPEEVTRGEVPKGDVRTEDLAAARENAQLEYARNKSDAGWSDWENNEADRYEDQRRAALKGYGEQLEKAEITRAASPANDEVGDVPWARPAVGDVEGEAEAVARVHEDARLRGALSDYETAGRQTAAWSEGEPYERPEDAAARVAAVDDEARKASDVITAASDEADRNAGVAENREAARADEAVAQRAAYQRSVALADAFDKDGVYGGFKQEMLNADSPVGKTARELGIDLGGRNGEALNDALHRTLHKNPQFMKFFGDNASITRSGDGFKTIVGVNTDDVASGGKVHEMYKSLLADQKFIQEFEKTILTGPYKTLRAGLGNTRDIVSFMETLQQKASA